MVVSPFQGLAVFGSPTQGGAARLLPLRFALGCYVQAPSGRKPTALCLRASVAADCGWRQ